MSTKQRTKRRGETASIIKDLKKYQSYDTDESVYSLCIPGSNGLFGPNRLLQDMNRISNNETEKDIIFMRSIERIKFPHKLNLIETEARSRSSWQYEIYRLFRKRGYTELIEPDYYGIYRGFNGNNPLPALNRYKYVLNKVKSLPPNSKVVAISTSQGSAVLLKCLENPEFCRRIKCVTFVSPAYTDRFGGTKLTKEGSTILDLKRITQNILNNNIFSVLLNTQLGFGGDESMSLSDREKLQSVSLHRRFLTTDHSFTSTEIKPINKNKIMTIMKIIDVMYTISITHGMSMINNKLVKYLDYIQDYFNIKGDHNYSPQLLTEVISEDDYFKDKSQSSDISENDSDVNISHLKINLMNAKKTPSRPNKSRSSRPNKSASTKPSKSAAVEKDSSPCTQFHGQPIKCNSYSKDDVHCYYTAAKIKGKMGLCKKGEKYNIESSRRNSRTNKLLRNQFESSAASTIQKAFKNKQLSKIPEKSSIHSRTASTQNKSDRESRSDTPSEVNRNKWMLRKQQMDIRKAHSERLDQEIEAAQRRVTELEQGSKKKKLLKSSSKKKKKNLHKSKKKSK